MPRTDIDYRTSRSSRNRNDSRSGRQGLARRLARCSSRRPSLRCQVPGGARDLRPRVRSHDPRAGTASRTTARGRASALGDGGDHGAPGSPHVPLLMDEQEGGPVVNGASTLRRFLGGPLCAASAAARYGQATFDGLPPAAAHRSKTHCGDSHTDRINPPRSCKFNTSPHRSGDVAAAQAAWLWRAPAARCPGGRRNDGMADARDGWCPGWTSRAPEGARLAVRR